MSKDTRHERGNRMRDDQIKYCTCCISGEKHDPRFAPRTHSYTCPLAKPDLAPQPEGERVREQARFEAWWKAQDFGTESDNGLSQYDIAKFAWSARAALAATTPATPPVEHTPRCNTRTYPRAVEDGVKCSCGAAPAGKPEGSERE